MASGEDTKSGETSAPSNEVENSRANQEENIDNMKEVVKPGKSDQKQETDKEVMVSRTQENHVCTQGFHRIFMMMMRVMLNMK